MKTSIALFIILMLFAGAISGPQGDCECKITIDYYLHGKFIKSMEPADGFELFGDERITNINGKDALTDSMVVKSNLKYKIKLFKLGY